MLQHPRHTILSGLGLEGDIRSCFDQISHEWLLAHIPMNKTILRKWLKAGFMDEDILYPTEAGTPQGGIISPVLANLALDGLEKALEDAFPKRLRQQYKLHLVRFADDFIIVCASKEVLEEPIKPLVERFLQNEDWNSRPKRRTSRTSRTVLTSWARTSASTTTSSLSSRRARACERA